MKKPVKKLEGTALWGAFMHQCILAHGFHILELGQTRTGKTNKKVTINRWLVERGGETLGILDCGKPGEVLLYANYGLPFNLIIPSGCDVTIRNSPVAVYKNYAETPELSWHFIKENMINIFTFRAHIIDDLTNGEYASRFMRVLLDQVMRNKLTIPRPFVLDVDEISDLLPAYGLIENKYQKEAAAKFSKVLKKIAFMGIRVHGADQAWGDVYPNARRQFAFLVVSRSPGTEAKTDVGIIKRYSFESLAINQAKIIFPQKNWEGTWEFPLVTIPDGMTIEYEGEVFWARKRRPEKSQVDELVFVPYLEKKAGVGV